MTGFRTCRINTSSYNLVKKLIKTCLGCAKEFATGDKRSKYCRKDCYYDNGAGKTQFGRVQSEETKAKIRASLAAHRAAHPGKGRGDGSMPASRLVRKTPEERSAIASDRARATAKIKQEQIDASPWEALSPYLRFKRVKYEQKGACNRCGNDTWLGQPMTLEIEHINGIHSDNDRCNLEALCPNCHSYTSTWRGRNAGNKVTDEQMIAALKAHPSITQALLSLGMAAKGNNFKRAKKLLGVPDGVLLPRKPGNTSR